MTARTFKNVTIAGASGNVGGPLIKALLASKQDFNVSVLIRASSTAIFPPQVTVNKVEDYNSHSDLVSVLKGQDAIICTFNDAATLTQVPLINAAIEAGVRRFIPSEFASNEWTAPVPELEDLVASKVAVRELLLSKAKETAQIGQEFHWTAVNNGFFFDWCLKVGFFDIHLPPNKHATIWDTGSNLFSVTNLSTVAAAVVAIMSDNKIEQDTRDRFVNIESLVVSQNDIVAALEKSSGEKWTIEKTSTKAQLTIAQEQWESGEYQSAYYGWLRGEAFSGKPGCRIDSEVLDNQLLGLTQETLQGTVEKILKGEEA